MSLYDDIPGLRDAIAKQEFIRDSSLMPVTENLCGFEVRQMTLIDFVALRLVKSPFIVGGIPDCHAIRTFLWRMSPRYNLSGGWHRWRIMMRCKKYLIPLEPMIHTRRAVKRWGVASIAALERRGRVIIAIRDFVKDTLQDWPSGKAPIGDAVSYYSDAVAIVGSVAREYGWSYAELTSIPLKLLLQCHKEIKASSGAKVLFNPSDGVIQDWQREINRANKVN